MNWKSCLQVGITSAPRRDAWCVSRFEIEEVLCWPQPCFTLRWDWAEWGSDLQIIAGKDSGQKSQGAQVERGVASKVLVVISRCERSYLGDRGKDEGTVSPTVCQLRYEFQGRNSF